MRAQWWSVPLLVAVAGCTHDWDSLPAVIDDAAVADEGVPAEDVPAEDVTAEDTAAEDATAEDVTGADVTAEDVTAADVIVEDVPAVDVPAVDVPAVDVPVVDVPVARDAGVSDAGLFDAPDATGPVDAPQDTAVDRPVDPCPDAGLALCGGACRDLRSDPAHCGACGRACRTPINGSTMCRAGACVTTCAAGFQELPSHDCATFGGATSRSGGSSVCGVNPMAEACACPEGFNAGPTYAIRGLTEPASTSAVDVNVRLCQVAAPAGAGEWGGSFLYRRSVLPLASDCVTGNAYRAMACACPVGFTEIQQVPVRAGHSNAQLDLYLCSRPPPPGQTRTYLGAYVTLIGGFVTSPTSGTSCVSPNIFTAACSCPAGARSVSIPSMAAGVLISSGTVTHSSTAPAMITLCMR